MFKKLLLSLCLLLLCLMTACGSSSESIQSMLSSDVPEISDEALSAESDIPQTAEEPSDAAVLSILSLNVGKADAHLISVDGHYMLIDAGEASDGKYILKALSARGIDHLDCMLITHFDKDHVGSAAMLLANLQIDWVMYPDYVGTRPEYLEFMAAIENHPNALAISQPMQASLGSAVVDFYPAENMDELIEAAVSSGEESDNDLSIVARLTCQNKTFLFCGDVEGARIQQMLSSDVNYDCDWMKLPHHGKYEKAVKTLLKETTPQYVVITASNKEPAEEKTLKCLADLNISGCGTATGDVLTTFDGNTISMSIE